MHTRLIQPYGSVFKFDLPVKLTYRSYSEISMEITARYIFILWFCVFLKGKNYYFLRLCKNNVVKVEKRGNIKFTSKHIRNVFACKMLIFC